MAIPPFLPTQLPWLFDALCGQDWPAGDEDALRRCAQAWDDALKSVMTIAGDANDTTLNVLTTVASMSADEFTKYYLQYTGGSNGAMRRDPADAALGQLAAQCQSMVSALDGQANEVEYTKLVIDITLVLTAIQILWAIAAAIATMGTSLAEIPILTLISRLTVQGVAWRFVQMVLMMILPDLIAQAWMLEVDHTEGSWDGSKTGAAFENAIVGGTVGALLGGAAAKWVPFMGEDAARTLAGRLLQIPGHFIEGGLTMDATTLATMGINYGWADLHGDTQTMQQIGQQFSETNWLGQFASGGVLATAFYLPSLGDSHGTPMSFTGDDGKSYTVKLDAKTFQAFDASKTLPDDYQTPVYDQGGRLVGNATFNGQDVSITGPFTDQVHAGLTGGRGGFTITLHDGTIQQYGYPSGSDHGAELLSYSKPSDGPVTYQVGTPSADGTVTPDTTVSGAKGSVVHYSPDGTQVLSADLMDPKGGGFTTVQAIEQNDSGQLFQVTGRAEFNYGPLGAGKVLGLHGVTHYAADGTTVLGSTNALTGHYTPARADSPTSTAEVLALQPASGHAAGLTASEGQDPALVQASPAGNQSSHEAHSPETVVFDPNALVTQQHLPQHGDLAGHSGPSASDGLPRPGGPGYLHLGDQSPAVEHAEIVSVVQEDGQLRVTVAHGQHTATLLVDVDHAARRVVLGAIDFNGDDLREFAAKVRGAPGMFDVFGHADADGLLIDGMHLPFRELGKLSLGIPEDAAAIRLFGCQAGAGDAVAELAAVTQRDVIAANTDVWIDKNGYVIAASSAESASGAQPNLDPSGAGDGSWEVIHPDGTRSTLTADDPRYPQSPPAQPTGETVYGAGRSPNDSQRELASRPPRVTPDYFWEQQNASTSYVVAYDESRANYKPETGFWRGTGDTRWVGGRLFSEAWRGAHLWAEVPPGDFRYARELAAYDVDQMLGFNLIPTTAEGAFDTTGPHGPGSLQEWVPGGASQAVDRYSLADQQRMAVLDYVMANSDRNPGNYLTRDDGRLVAIDHGEALSVNEADGITSQFVGAWRDKPLSPEVLEQVRAVDLGAFRDMLRSHGISEQAADLAARRLQEIQEDGTITGREYGGEIRSPDSWFAHSSKPPEHRPIQSIAEALGVQLPSPDTPRHVVISSVTEHDGHLVVELSDGERTAVMRVDAAGGGLVFSGQGEAGQVLLEMAAMAQAEPGAYNVFGHADAGGLVIDGMHVPPEELAQLLADVPEGAIIRLYGCQAGAGDVAARLAELTGHDVIAADSDVWLDKNGRVLATGTEQDATGRPQPRLRPDGTGDGTWRVFRPDGSSRTLAHDDPSFPPGFRPALGDDLLRLAPGESFDGTTMFGPRSAAELGLTPEVRELAGDSGFAGSGSQSHVTSGKLLYDPEPKRAINRAFGIFAEDAIGGGAKRWLTQFIGDHSDPGTYEDTLDHQDASRAEVQQARHDFNADRTNQGKPPFTDKSMLNKLRRNRVGYRQFGHVVAETAVLHDNMYLGEEEPRLGSGGLQPGEWDKMALHGIPVDKQQAYTRQAANTVVNLRPAADYPAFAKFLGDERQLFINRGHGTAGDFDQRFASALLDLVRGGPPAADPGGPGTQDMWQLDSHAQALLDLAGQVHGPSGIQEFQKRLASSDPMSAFQTDVGRFLRYGASLAVINISVEGARHPENFFTDLMTWNLTAKGQVRLDDALGYYNVMGPERIGSVARYGDWLNHIRPDGQKPELPGGWVERKPQQYTDGVPDITNSVPANVEEMWRREREIIGLYADSHGMLGDLASAFSGGDEAAQQEVVARLIGQLTTVDLGWPPLDTLLRNMQVS